MTEGLHKKDRVSSTSPIRETRGIIFIITIGGEGGKKERRGNLFSNYNLTAELRMDSKPSPELSERGRSHSAPPTPKSPRRDILSASFTQNKRFSSIEDHEGSKKTLLKSLREEEVRALDETRIIKCVARVVYDVEVLDECTASDSGNPKHGLVEGGRPPRG